MYINLITIVSYREGETTILVTIWGYSGCTVQTSVKKTQMRGGAVHMKGFKLSLCLPATKENRDNIGLNI